MIKALMACVILAVIFGGISLIIGVLFSSIKMLRRDGIGNARKVQSNEALLIQKIYQGLNKMEARVESLETILMEKQGKEEQDGRQ
jgi:phage shock protein B